MSNETDSNLVYKNQLDYLKVHLKNFTSKFYSSVSKDALHPKISKLMTIIQLVDSEEIDKLYYKFSKLIGNL